MTTTPSTDLPVPYESLLELGLTEEDIVKALASAPAVLAFQADQAEGARFDVGRVKKALAALGQFRHTKGRWARDRRRLRLGEGLDPWQVVWVIAPVFGWVAFDPEVEAEVRVVRAVWIEVPRKAGKALDVSTPILTDRGWSTMGALRIGDRLHAPDGTWASITAMSDVFDDHDCYRVTFSDGQSVVADAGHLWTLRDRYSNQPTVTVDTETMAGRYLIGSREAHRERRYSVSMPAPLDRPEVDLPIDPYVLGTWLGDGETCGARITSADPETFVAVEAAGYRLGASSGGGITRSVLGLRAQLRVLGVLGNKHVPEQYLLASEKQRLALLQGLMDTDGTATRGSGAPRCEFTSTNRALADAVLFLARSLGWKATLGEGRATLQGRDCGPKYRVSWCAYRDESPFRLQRKTDRLSERGPRPARSRTLQVVGVDRVPTVRTRCVQVDRSDGMYLAGPGLVPTHNSTLSSGLANVLLLADGEIGAEVYAAAASLPQAGRVFEDAKKMCLTSTQASKKVRALAGVMTVPHTGGVFRALSKVAETAHGLNVSAAVIDEVHVHKRRDLIDAIETGTGAREQPLIIFITTADEATEGSIYDEKHTYTRNVANNVVQDPTHYGVVWAADDKDDPFAEATWRKANPGLGVSPTLSYLRKEAAKAKTTPTYFPTFCRLHLNLRMRGQSRLIDLRQWDDAKGPCDLEALKRQRAWGGFDLSAVSDLSAWWLGVESKRPGVELEMFWRFWLPEESIEDLERQLMVPLRQWVDEGWIALTDGNVIDYEAIRDAALKDCEHLQIQRISYDRMFAGQMVQEIDTKLKGVEVVPVAQTFYGSSPAVKELQRLLGSGEQGGKPRMLHGPNPVARWMASLVEAKNDGLDNLRLVKPDRQKSQSRIDGMSAMVTGLDGYVRRPVKRRYDADAA